MIRCGVPLLFFLPKAVGGLDKENQVFLAVYTSQAVPGDWSVAIRSTDTSKLKMEGGSTIAWSIPQSDAGRQLYSNGSESTDYSDAGKTAIVAGVGEWISASSNAQDACVIEAVVNYTVVSSVRLWRYRLELGLSGAGDIPQPLIDDEIAAAHPSQSGSYDGDNCLGAIVPSGLAIAGAEHTADQTVFVGQSLTGGQWVGGIYFNPPKEFHFNMKLEEIDGTSVVGYDERTGLGHHTVYAKTSCNTDWTFASLWGRTGDPRVLSSGDTSVKILGITSIDGGPFRIHTGDTGASRAAGFSTEFFDSWMKASFAGGRSAFCGSPITSQLKNDPAIVVVRSVPEGAFAGEASCCVRIERAGEYKAEAVASANGTAVVAQALSAAGLEYDGVNWGTLAASLLDQSEGEAKAIVSSNLFLGIPAGTKLVVAGSPTPLQQSRSCPARSDLAPFQVAMVANATLTDSKQFINVTPASECVTNAQAVVFSVGSGNGQTSLPLWGTTGAIAAKRSSNDFAFAWIKYAPVELKTPTDTQHTAAAPFRIWSRN